jgi:archaellum biogenesis ATPase FlaH
MSATSCGSCDNGVLYGPGAQLTACPTCNPPAASNGHKPSRNGHAPATLRRVDVAAMLTTEPEPVDWIAEGIVARGTLTLIAGREKEGKSLLAMAIAARAATGGGLLAGIDVRAARTLIVDAENGERELHRRLRSSGLTGEYADRIEVYETHGHDLRQHLHELEAVLRSHKPDLLILDSWRSLWGGDENDAGEVARVLDPLRNLIRQHNAGAVLIHHMRKNGGYRGSSAIGASVESVVELARVEDDPERRRRRLRNTACRYEQEADERWLCIEADRARGLLLIDETEPYVPSTDRPRDDHRADVLAVLGAEPCGERKIAAAVGLSKTTARRILQDLESTGGARQTGDGWVVHRSAVQGVGPVDHPQNGDRPACSCVDGGDVQEGRCQRCWGWSS